MHKIYKYDLNLEDRQTLDMPKNSDLLSVQMKDDVLVSWWYVNTEEEETEKRIIYVVGTGNEFHTFLYEQCNFITTIQDEFFVWHIFLGDD